MALTERDDVISLAGGLPDTSTFPADSYAALMSTVAADSCARALQYGPTEGLAVSSDCIVEVMAAEAMEVDEDEVLVTTGGQQVIDLVCKTLLDPGDVVVCEAPTYPGAVPTFCAYQADVVQVTMDRDGMRIDELEATLDELERAAGAQVHLHGPELPQPGRRDAVARAPPRAVRIAAERELLVLEDNPYGLLRYEGMPLPTLRSLDEEFIIYASTFSKILSPGVRLGWAAAPAPVLAKMSRQAGADLCSSSISQYFVRHISIRALGELRPLADRDLSAPARRDARRARRALPAGGQLDPPARGAVRLGDAARLHRHHRPAGARARGARRVRAGSGRVRRRPRRLVDAAEFLGRRGRRHPRGDAAASARSCASRSSCTER